MINKQIAHLTANFFNIIDLLLFCLRQKKAPNGSNHKCYQDQPTCEQTVVELVILKNGNQFAFLHIRIPRLKIS